MGALITIVGNSGVGKTTFAKRLAEAGGFTTGLEEHASRPFQALFSRDLARWSLANQVDYLLFRARQEQDIRQGASPGVQDGGLELDYFVFTHHFYRKGYLQPAEFKLCQRMYETLRGLLPPPDLIVRLAAPLEVIVRRYAQRGRPLEIARRSDLGELELLLDEWLQGIEDIPLVTVDAAGEGPDYTESIRQVMENVNYADDLQILVKPARRLPPGT
jgi:deoxyadenosine/deoxycytidine kinase